MYTNHVNPIALQTQDRFTAALFALMEQKTLEQITVTELCRAAGFERVTFYRHFDRKDDVLVYYLDRQMMTLLGTVPPRTTLRGNVYALFRWVYSERSNLCLLMDSRMTIFVSDALGRSVFLLLSANLSAQELELFPVNPYAEGDSFLYYAVMGLFVGLITAWRSGGFAEPAEQVADRMLLLLSVHPELLRE